MIKRFKIFERLGYSEEVSKLADYVWKKYKEGQIKMLLQQGQLDIDLSDYTKNNMSIFINKLIIDEYRDKNSGTRMTACFGTYPKTKNVKITINKVYKPTIMSLEHELKHFYDFIKAGNYLYAKDQKLLGAFQSLSTTDKWIKKFIKLMYYLETLEIEAYYHSDIRNFAENKHKFKNNIKHYIKYSRLQYNLNYINDIDFKGLLFLIDKNDKEAILRLFHDTNDQYEIMFNKSGINQKYNNFKRKFLEYLRDAAILNNKTYSEEKVEKFFDRLEKEVEKKKKVYLKYIDRLVSYFS